MLKEVDLYTPGYSYSSTSNLVADALSSWLSQEYRSASDSHNRYLDDIEETRLDLALPLEDPFNKYFAKHKSHHLRQSAQFSLLYRGNITDDHVSALSLFNVLMGMSGAARRLVALDSADQATYYQRRHDDNPTGIDLVAAVDARLRYRLGDEVTPDTIQSCDIDLETVLSGIDRAFNLVEECFRFIHS